MINSTVHIYYVDFREIQLGNAAVVGVSSANNATISIAINYAAYVS
jgi:hypothetical protein